MPLSAFKPSRVCRFQAIHAFDSRRVTDSCLIHAIRCHSRLCWWFGVVRCRCLRLSAVCLRLSHGGCRCRCQLCGSLFVAVAVVARIGFPPGLGKKQPEQNNNRQQQPGTAQSRKHRDTTEAGIFPQVRAYPLYRQQVRLKNDTFGVPSQKWNFPGIELPQIVKTWKT
jgi:hypothetical protein